MFVLIVRFHCCYSSTLHVNYLSAALTQRIHKLIVSTRSNGERHLLMANALSSIDLKIIFRKLSNKHLKPSENKLNFHLFTFSIYRIL